ncbi:hypothetical protein HYALB_00008648 [Hymenoscyphus albidus]|uniref:Invertebrate defensins family profile domain-containing protein n=1 Tax=Hymenoscyphus albidus TaxID=595503 RepID=A0A9N9PRQ8_9HELO|nr:hypothetical protein HYALB_00008648 [Hymenoscyphus albidus]
MKFTHLLAVAFASLAVAAPSALAQVPGSNALEGVKCPHQDACEAHCKNLGGIRTINCNKFGNNCACNTAG